MGQRRKEGCLKRNNLPPGSRRAFLALPGALAAVPLLPGCGWLFDKPITLAVHVWVGYESLFLARDKGWLDVKQVQLLETRSAVESLKALAEGRVQGAALTLDEMLSARASGLPLSLVMVFDISLGADTLLVRPDIKTLAALKGRRLGYESSSVGAVMLTQILESAGLTQSEVQLTSISLDQQHDAWRKHQVDALITYEPLSSQLLAQGAVKLFDSRQIPNSIIDVLVMRRDALKAPYAQALRHLVHSHFRALDYLKRNPQDAAYRMARHLNLPSAGVQQAFKGLLLPDVANNYRLLAGASPELIASAQKLSRLMVKGRLLKQDDSLTDLIEADFLPTDGWSL
jgi:NitT/TauT family transport system substrate-binding protein